MTVRPVPLPSQSSGVGSRTAWEARRAATAIIDRAITFDYYVDPVNGLDANAGTSPSAAWKTLAKVNTGAGANKKVGLKRGGVWRETFTVPADGMTFGAYGPVDQPNPVVKGSKDYSAISGQQWVIDSAASGRWKLTGITNPGSVNTKAYYADFGELFPVASAAACTAAASTLSPLNALDFRLGLLTGVAPLPTGSFYVDTAGTTLYVALPNGVNPNNMSIEVNDLTGIGWTSRKNGIVEQDIDIRHFANINYFKQPPFANQGGTLARCTIGPGLNAGINWSGNGGDGPQGGKIYDCVIRGIWNNLPYGGSGAGSGLIVSAAQGLEVSYNLFVDCYAASLFQNNHSDCKVHHNVVIRSKVNGLNFYVGVVGHPALVYNNTVLHRPLEAGAAGHGIVAEDGNGNLVSVPVVFNNIVICDYTGVATNVQAYAVQGNTLTAPGLADGWWDYNLAYIAPGCTAGIAKVQATTYTTLSTWQAALASMGLGGNQAHGVVAAPLIADIRNGDYSLLPGSPALDVGHNGHGYTGLTSGTPDLGAYEAV